MVGGDRAETCQGEGRDDGIVVGEYSAAVVALW